MHRFFIFHPVALFPYWAVGVVCLKWEQKLEGRSLDFDLLVWKIMKQFCIEPKDQAQLEDDMKCVDNILAGTLIPDPDVENAHDILKGTYAKWKVMPNGKCLKNKLKI